jgi:hypothetical protein
MEASHFGWLFVMLSYAGFFGLPLGLPPEPEDRTVAAVAPEKCLFYTSWTAIAKPDPKSANQTEQLLAEPDVRQFVGHAGQWIKTAVIEGAKKQMPPQDLPKVNDVYYLVRTALSHSAAFFVGDVSFKAGSPKAHVGTPVKGDGDVVVTTGTCPVASIHAGAIVQLGGEAEKVKQVLDRFQKMLPGPMAKDVQIGGETWHRISADPSVPALTWGLHGTCLMAGVGEGALEGMLKRAGGAAPEWLAGIAARLPVQRRSTVTYVDVKALLALVQEKGPAMVGKVLAALGLTDVTALEAVSGLDHDGYVARIRVGFDGPPRGLLNLVGNKPLRPEDLAPIPRDATLAAVERGDADLALETLLAILSEIEPQAGAAGRQTISAVEAKLGISLRKDLLQSLGDVWCLYNSPSEGGLVFTGMTLVVSVKDHARLATANEKLLAAVRTELQRLPKVKIREFEFAKQKVYYLDVAEQSFMAAPAWCVTDTSLVVALFPQNVKAHLSRGPTAPSLAQVPEVARVFQSGGAPVWMAYEDVPALFKLCYPFVPMVAKVMITEAQRNGIPADLAWIPSAWAIARHLRPGVEVLERKPTGIELTSRHTLPGAGAFVGTYVGAAGAFMATRVDARHRAYERYETKKPSQ